jgi:hypothetical protein
MRQWQTLLGSDEEKPPTILGNSETRGIENTVGQQHFVATLLERFYEFVEKLPVPPDGQSLYVLEDEVVGIQFSGQADELQQEAIAGIVQRSLPHEREALAGSAAEYHVDTRVAESCRLTDAGACQCRCVSANGHALGKVEFMDGAVDGIDLHRGTDIEPGLFEPERQTASPRKEVDAYGPSSTVLSPQETHRCALPTFAGFSIRIAR